MLKSAFFDFMNRRADFDHFLSSSVLDRDYINWNGLVLPYDYGNAEEEYSSLRNSCAIFDVSPLRKYRITGDEAGEFLDKLLTRPASTAASMTGIYVIFCHEDGTLIDDSILYKFSNDDYLLMPSDMDHSAYFDSLIKRFRFQAVSILDCTDEWVGMAIQGPLSAAVLLNMGCENVDKLVPYEVRQFPFAGGQIQVARMGFTADLGYECWLEPGLASEFTGAIELARESMDLAIPGYGLSTLEACRLEGGFIVAGWDFATKADPAPGFERNPFEVGLGWLVELDGVDFVGKKALVEKKREGSRYGIRGFQTADVQEVEDGASIYGSKDGAEIVIGSVNCSTWSWGLESLIGNASIYTEHVRTRDLWIRVNDRPVKITLRRGPFINLDRRTQIPAPLG